MYICITQSPEESFQLDISAGTQNIQVIQDHFSENTMVWMYMGVSENSVALNPMVNDPYPY